MLIRALCLLLVLTAGPASAREVASCCDPAGGCCDGEHPDCPVLPDGECSFAAMGQALATVQHSNERTLSAPPPSFERAAQPLHDPMAIAAASVPARAPARPQSFAPLRN